MLDMHKERFQAVTSRNIRQCTLGGLFTCFLSQTPITRYALADALCIAGSAHAGWPGFATTITTQESLDDSE